jgi:hypothetical protein
MEAGEAAASGPAASRGPWGGKVCAVVLKNVNVCKERGTQES